MRDFLALVLVWTACVAASPALPRSVSRVSPLRPARTAMA